jgi:outer membrane protein assembly factor BamB
MVTDAGKVAWTVPLPSSPEGSLPAPVVINGIALFPGNSDLTAVRAADGRRLWNIHIDHPHNPLPRFFDRLWRWGGAAYALINYSTPATTDLRLVQLDPATGKVRWRLKLNRPVDSITQPSQSGIVGLAVGGSIETVSLTGGAVLWSRAFAKPVADGAAAIALTMANEVLVAATTTRVSGHPIVTAAAFDAKGGRKFWQRGGFPTALTLTADGTVVLFNGDDTRPPFTASPLIAVAAATGKTLWHTPVKGVVGKYIWATPTDVVFSDGRRIYDANPATGLRWSIPGSTYIALLTGTDLVYSQWKEIAPLKPPVSTVYDRRLRDAKLRWTLSQPPSVILAPAGPNLLLGDSYPYSANPVTLVYAVDKQTGEKVTAKVKLPAGVFASPAVVGSDAIYQLNPWQCAAASASSAWRGAS